MAKATRVLSTPRRTASKNQTQKRNKVKRLALGNSRRASLARAKQIVELLSTCYVREGWKIDEAAAERALAYCRANQRTVQIRTTGERPPWIFSIATANRSTGFFAAIFAEWSAGWRSIRSALTTSPAPLKPQRCCHEQRCQIPVQRFPPCTCPAPAKIHKRHARRTCRKSRGRRCGDCASGRCRVVGGKGRRPIN
jgi:hypothetical protein